MTTTHRVRKGPRGFGAGGCGVGRGGTGVGESATTIVWPQKAAIYSASCPVTTLPPSGFIITGWPFG